LSLTGRAPSHRRVHHAVHPACLDRHYGSMLIVFDRLVASVAAGQAADPRRYGLAHQVRSRNPPRMAFFRWSGMLRHLRVARG
jgi:hypothetical protein